MKKHEQIYGDLSRKMRYRLELQMWKQSKEFVLESLWAKLKALPTDLGYQIW